MNEFFWDGFEKRAVSMGALTRAMANREKRVLGSPRAYFHPKDTYGKQPGIMGKLKDKFGLSTPKEAINSSFYTSRSDFTNKGRAIDVLKDRYGENYQGKRNSLLAKNQSTKSLGAAMDADWQGHYKKISDRLKAESR